MTTRTTFNDELAALSSRVGERNRRLFTIALKGRAENLAQETVITQIIEASGVPPLTRAEVERAVRKVWKMPIATRQSRVIRRLFDRHPPKRQETSASSGFVRDMIALGGGEATSADLIRASPCKVPSDAETQAILFCRALNEPDARFFFLGRQYDKRTRERLMSMDEFEALLVFGDIKVLPTHILPNDLTGEPAKNEKGEDSYGLEVCLLHRRYAVVEFDAMPIRQQAAFWLGVLRSQILPVRSLVYSGSKSIHALLRLDDEKPFAEQWKILEKALASDPDPAYRCDLACRNPGRLTRFPGAIRPESKRRQQLLYLNDGRC